MNNRPFLHLFFIFFVASSNLVWSENWESGGEPWAFLKMGVGARAMGMGGAFVSVADDATAPYWNPAGLGILREKMATTMYVQSNPPGDESALAMGIHGYLSYCHPTAESGNFGVSVNYFRINDIMPTIATPDGDFRFDGPPESDNEWALNLSYGLSLPRRLAGDERNPRIFLGTNGRIMGQDFMGYSTKGLGSDIGIIVSIIDGYPGKNPIENLKVGYVLKYNSKRNWKRQEIGQNYSDSAILGWQLGASSKILLSSSPSSQNPSLTLATSLIKAAEGVPLAMAFGCELKAMGLMAIRAGWRRNKESNIFTGGFGLEYKPIQVDYAISSEPLGIKHRVSLSASF